MSGRATGPSGAIIPGVQISAQNASTNVVSVGQTDGSGYYTLHLPSGDYTIAVDATGFATLQQKGVRVTIGGDVGLDFHLEVASTTTSVEVHADASAELITPDTTAVQTTANNDLVSTMPIEASGTIRRAGARLSNSASLFGEL